MKKLALALLLGLCATQLAPALVVRPAPNVEWIDSTNARQDFSKFRGQPIVLIIATSPRAWIFRAQVGQLQRMYQRFAADRAVFVVAFTSEPGTIRSNIPFAIAADGPKVALDYQFNGKFGVAVIGRDGNLDCYSNRVLPAERIYDLIDNSFVPQEALRRP